jgi:hypothetical protein
MSGSFARPERSLERKKSKKMLEDIKLATIKTTEVRTANAHVSYTPGVSNMTVGKTAELPHWHRLLTFIQFIVE